MWRRYGSLTFFYCCLALLYSSHAFSEVSVGELGASPGLLLTCSGGSNDPLPVPGPWWIVRQHINSTFVLNSDGAARGDGPASFCFHPGSGAPVISWTREDQAERHVVIAEWDSPAWTTPRRVDQSGTDNLDPRITCSNELVRVVWWSPSSGVFLSNCGAEGCDGARMLQCLTSSCRRPDITELGGAIVVIAEAVDPGFSAVQVTVGSLPPAEIGRTSFAGPRGDGDIDVQIHTDGQVLWADWAQADHLMAFSTFDPVSETWTEPETVSYTWDLTKGEFEEIAREGARVMIRILVRSRK